MSQVAEETLQEATTELQQEVEEQKPKVEMFDITPKKDDVKEEDDFGGFDSKEEAEEYAKIMRTKKREAFNEAKTYRLKLQEAESKLGELERKMSEQEQALASDYQRKIEELEQRQAEQAQVLAQYQQAIEQQQVRQAELQFNHAAEKHGIEEREFLKYKWHEHLKSVNTEEEVNLDSFISEMKEKHPSVFGGKKTAPEAPPANSGLPPQQAAPSSTPADGIKGKISQTPADRMKLNSEWEAYKKAHNLK